MKKLILAASLAALFTAGQALAETIKIGVTPPSTRRSWSR